MATVRCVCRCSVYILIALLPIVAAAQIAGPNINMVSGTQFPGGDPYLQRQNEPSMAVSTRNSMHIVAGANDYRTVDLPGLPDGEEIGDAWLGLFKSFDGGLTWISTLIAGYPQDTSPEGLGAPIRQAVNGITFPAAADPMVRSGLNGMFYYSGIGVTRTTPPVSAVFVARFNDFNNREGSDPIHSLGMSIVADGRPGKKFFDKPSLLADLPRPGAALCSVGGQFFPAGNVYVVYTAIEMSGSATTAAKLWLSRSTDCGSTWSNPILISGTNTLNQGSVMAIDTWSGALYVVWRRFASGAETNAILVAKSVDGGAHFSAPVVIHSFTPFEQGTTPSSFRTSAYPTAVTDANGRLYVAWSERAGPSGSLVKISDKRDGRIMLSTSADGNTWSTPVMPVPTAPIAPLSGRGHQFMPALSYASGKVMLAYYDLRQDSTIGHYSPSPFFKETRFLLGDLASSPLNLDNVFNNFIQDASITGPLLRRHTLDIRASQAAPGPMPVFEDSQPVSQYRFGSTPSDSTIRQLEFNPPNFTMFKTGTVPFFGDYIDLVPQYPFLSSILNLPIPAPVFYAVWTDNRDVRPPLDGNWANYTPVAVFGGASKVDPTTTAPVCAPGQTGMRNQNIYTSRVTAGLFFGSPGNDKPLGKIQRAFAVTVWDTKTTPQSYRLQIFNQPPGGKASFQQLPLSAPALTTLDITVNAKSSASRSVFVTSTVKNAPVGVVVTEIPAVGGTPAPGALTSATVLNPDPSSPDIGTPDIGTPDIGSAEVYTPDIGTPDIGTPNINNPDIGTPDIGTPDIGTPDIGTPDIGTPDIGTPAFANPDIGTPDIGTPDIGSGSVTDTTWPLSDDGNTAASYTVKLLQTGSIPFGIKLQMFLHQTYRTPIAQNCTLTTERHAILLANVPRPTVLTSTSGIGSPDIGTPSVPTVAITPGNPVNITVRVVDPNHKNVVIPAYTFLSPVVVAHAVATADLNNPNPQPQIALVIITGSLPDAITGRAYSSTVQAIGGLPPYSWSVENLQTGDFLGGLPRGLSINPSTGVISGVPDLRGSYGFVVDVRDSAPTPHFVRQRYTIHVADPLSITTTGLPNGVTNVGYAASLAASGGLSPLTWALATGSALPAGLSLASGGAISGVPTTAGTTSTSFVVADSSSPQQSAQATFSIQINQRTLNLQWVTQPTNTVAGQAIQPAPAVRLSDNSGALIPGATVTISLGANPGGSGFTSQTALTDSTGTASFPNIVISNTGVGYTLIASVTSGGLTGSSTSQSFDVLVPAITFDVTPTSTLFYMNSSSVPINGTVTNNTDVTQSIIVIQHWIDQSSLTIAAAGWQIVTASDFAMGTIPAHTQLNLISNFHAANASFASAAGMTPGPATLRIQLRRQQGSSDILLQTLSFAITLATPPPPPLTITTTSPLPDGYQGSVYNDANNNPVALSSSGGTGTITWTLAHETTLPDGLVLSANGGIGGNPTRVEYKSVDITATDSGSPQQTTTKTFAIQTWSQASVFCPSPSKPLFNNTNDGATANGGVAPTITTPGRSFRLVAMFTYHYNDGVGTSATGHTLGLGQLGPWPVDVQNAQGNVPANWIARVPTNPAPTLTASSSYLVVDSDGSSTWSQNSGTGGFGFTQVCVVPISP